MSARRKPKPTKREPFDPEQLAAALDFMPRIKVTVEGSYKAIDRYRDFSRVFGSVEGQRVLAQIVTLGTEPVRPADMGNHDLMVWRHATRFLVLKIADWAANPPPVE